MAGTRLESLGLSVEERGDSVGRAEFRMPQLSSEMVFMLSRWSFPLLSGVTNGA